MKQQSAYIPVPVEERLPEIEKVYHTDVGKCKYLITPVGFPIKNGWQYGATPTYWLEKKEDVFVLTKEELKDFAEQARRYTLNNAQHVAQAGNAVFVMGSTDDFFEDWINTQKP